jgi:nitrate reductase gamma subunit
MELKLIEKIKQGVRNILSGALQVLEAAMQFGIPGVGATVSFAVGKWVAGLVLGVIALAVFFRLLWRRKHADRVSDESKLPLWTKLLALMSAVVSSAVLVEMTNLPVRFDQSGFSMLHWLIVVAVIFLLNGWFRSVFKSFTKARSTALIEKP